MVVKYVPDWFVTHQQIKIWYDNNDYCNDDELLEWYEGYQERTVQKASIKEELMPLAWIPSRWWDWCVPEDKRKRQKNCGHKAGYKNFSVHKI